MTGHRRLRKPMTDDDCCSFGIVVVLKIDDWVSQKSSRFIRMHWMGWIESPRDIHRIGLVPCVGEVVSGHHPLQRLSGRRRDETTSRVSSVLRGPPARWCFGPNGRGRVSRPPVATSNVDRSPNEPARSRIDRIAAIELCSGALNLWAPSRIGPPQASHQRAKATSRKATTAEEGSAPSKAQLASSLLFGGITHALWTTSLGCTNQRKAFLETFWKLSAGCGPLIIILIGRWFARPPVETQLEEKRQLARWHHLHDACRFFRGGGRLAGRAHVAGAPTAPARAGHDSMRPDWTMWGVEGRGVLRVWAGRWFFWLLGRTGAGSLGGGGQRRFESGRGRGATECQPNQGTCARRHGLQRPPSPQDI